jgi:glutaminyl-peptide cyclotransferase
MESYQIKIGQIFVAALLLFAACSQPPAREESDTAPATETVSFKKPSAPVPAFNADSAFFWVQKQLAFGPRTPGSQGHADCGNFLESKLKSYGFSVITQKPTITTFDNKSYRLYNIIGSYRPEETNRILLLAHWDTRPWADGDTKDRDKPIDGADDGASGVAVLLEVARLISQSAPALGVDIFFTDMEDYGQPDDSPFQKRENTWCLGTQYWAGNPHVPGYKARFGILLDMVGSKGARFPREGTGLRYASDIVDKVWKTAEVVGHADFFVSETTYPTTDDHLYVNTLAGIPCIDIVNMDPSSQRYGAYHHTHNDKIDIIDPATLKVVGTVLMEVLFRDF